MALERSWEHLGPVSFTADGGANGLVTVTDASCFKVKQKVVLLSTTQTSGLQAEVKRVLSPTTLLVGPRNNQKGGNRSLDTRLDISAFLVADSATIHAEEQIKAVPTPNDIIKAVYEQEPTLALRNLLVDKIGRGLSTSDLPEGVSVLDVNNVPDFTSTPVYGRVDITNSATLVRVGASNLSGRRTMIINPKGRTIYVGWDNTVTAGNNGTGLRVSSNTILFLSVAENIDVYAITSSGTARTHVTEGK